jgi:hypothetical protein
MPHRRYFVYRIVLQRAVWLCPKFRKRNADVLARNPIASASNGYYVGSTGQRVSRRVESHMLGNPGMGGANMVRLYAGDEDGEPEYAVVSEFVSRTDAEACERREAERLRGLGYGVWSNIKPHR